MQRVSPWLVDEHSIRPASSPDHCFYCHAPRGGLHTEDCVIRVRTVVVRFNVELVVAVPEDWRDDLINFKYNHGSWCADNLSGLIADAETRLNGQNCLCPVTVATYVREATDDDERQQQLFVENLPS